jgi:hypothetical protein
MPIAGFGPIGSACWQAGAGSGIFTHTLNGMGHGFRPSLNGALLTNL